MGRWWAQSAHAGRSRLWLWLSLQWGLVLPLGPEEGTAFAGRAVQVSGWGPLHAVHLHGCMKCVVASVRVRLEHVSRLHRAWYRARLEAAMLMRGCGAWAVSFGVLCGCVLLARARVHRAWYCARLEAAMLMRGCGAWAVGLCESIHLGEGRSRPGLRVLRETAFNKVKLS